MARLSRIMAEGKIVGSQDALGALMFSCQQNGDSNPTVPDAFRVDTPRDFPFLKESDADAWAAERLFYAGQRGVGGYSFFAYKGVGGDVMVFAGCRAFTLDEARRHWSLMHHERGEETAPLLDVIEEWSRTGEAHAVAVSGAAPVPVYDKALVHEFLGGQLTTMFVNWLTYQKSADSLRRVRNA